MFVFGFTLGFRQLAGNAKWVSPEMRHFYKRANSIMIPQILVARALGLWAQAD